MCLEKQLPFLSAISLRCQILLQKLTQFFILIVKMKLKVCLKKTNMHDLKSNNSLFFLFLSFIL